MQDFGAYPNDDKYDDVGIQAAVDAAEENGIGVVLFEAGQYKMSPNESTEEDQRLTVQGNNILLKGQGSGENGTNIFMDHKKLKGYGWPMMLVGAAGVDKYIRPITKLRGNAQRETFVIKVFDAKKLAVGQKVMLSTNSHKLLDDQLKGHPIAKKWEHLQEDGMRVREIHTIAAIDGNKITFEEPLHISLKEEYEVSIKTIGMIENVGIEDIRFTGNWPSYGEDFIHHKPGDAVHDYGWNMMGFEHVNNAWINNVEFKNFNQNLHFRTTSAITVSNVKLTGKKQ